MMLFYKMFNNILVSVFACSQFQFGIDWDFDLGYFVFNFAFLRVFVAKVDTFTLSEEEFLEISKKENE